MISSVNKFFIRLLTISSVCAIIMPVSQAVMPGTERTGAHSLLKQQRAMQDHERLPIPQVSP